MRSVELFAGAGGLAIGLEQSGFNPNAIIEFNKDACATLRRNYLGSSDRLLFEGDIRSFNYDEVSSPVRLVSGGPPCQPFSLGGNHKAHADNRDMFPQAVRAIRELQPQAFIFENVKGLLRKSFSEYFEYVLLQLQYPLIAPRESERWEDHLRRLEEHHTGNHVQELEYNVCFRLLNSADYGVPQKRERVFIVGFRKDLDVHWSFPAPTHSNDSLLWSKYVTFEYWDHHGLKHPDIDPKIKRVVNKLHSTYGLFAPTEIPWQTVRDAISDLPEPKKEGSSTVLNHEFKEGAKTYPGHTGSFIDEPSKTIKAGAHGVPGGENMIRFEDDTVRYLTVRESARIQTFPDQYRFEGAWGEAMRQIGNAVPVKLAEAVGSSVYKALERLTS
jgi:DNA (cytosine-5)-methyltransferase 1